MSAAAKATQTAAKKAAQAWGREAPDWILALAAEVDRTSGREAARAIGYSASVVSQVLGKSYPGDMGSVEARVLGALLGALVTCPVMGDTRRDRCMSEQKKNHVGTSSMRTRLFHACRGGCPHSRLKGGGDAA